MTTTIKVPFQKLTKILHLADIHIRLYKRHDEYREVFATLYDQLRKANDGSSVIVVAGDIVHAKTDLSPEIVVLTTEFLSTLANIAPTLVIPGNHDLNLANQSRLDALSPIISGINNDNLHYLKDSGIYEIGEVSFGVHSIIGDSAEWPSPNEQASTSIALFHGPLYNANTDVGYTVTSRHYDVSLFDGYDIVLLGDIHRHQTLQAYSAQEDKPIVVYPGSLVQQNHGESLKGHGWCEWNVDARSFQFHELPNTYGYYTLELDNGKVPPHFDMPKNVRLRIFAGDTPQTEIKKLVADVRQKHNVHELAVSTYVGAKTNTSTVAPPTIVDIADINYQNSIITDFLREAMPNISDEVLDKVIELNKVKNAEVGVDDVGRKIFWKPLQLKFSNLFTYGDDNFIDFTTKTGVVGIFAPNASGKTSIAEAICFALYDRTPRTTKAASIMNYSKTKSYCEFTFELAGKTYVIERKGKKNDKNEVKMDVDFYELEPSGKKISLNGEERRYTNENIREYVGSYEDFILTTFSSSTQAGLLVDRGQSDRKDLLSQFMGLGLLDRLYDIANNESKEIAGALKTFKNDDFTKELVDIRDAIDGEKQEAGRLQISFDNINTKLNELREKIIELTASKQKTTIIGNSEQSLQDDLDLYQNEKDILCGKLVFFQDELDKITGEIETAQHKYSTETGDIESRQYEYLRIDREFVRLNGEERVWKEKKKAAENQLSAASLHQYDPNCKYCLINGQHNITAKESATHGIKLAEDKLLEIRRTSEILRAEKDGLGDIEKEYADWKQLGQNLLVLEKKNSTTAAQLSDAELRISHLGQSIYNVSRMLEQKLVEREASEFNAKIDAEVAVKNADLAQMKKQFTLIQVGITKTASSIAVWESKEADILARIKKAEDLESKWEAYEAYLLAMHRDGLQYKLISDVLPMLEGAVNDILKQMAEFHLKFEMDGKNVNMKLAYDQDRIWPLELASGMEKFISGLAIRVALMSISNLPKSNFLIIDEGLGALDSDNLASIYMLFDVLKTKFDFIFLISHIDTTRDISDSLIDIERKNGVSRIYSA